MIEFDTNTTFPSCCTAVVWNDFFEDDLLEKTDNYFEPKELPTKKEIYQQLVNKKLAGFAVIVATLTSEQSKFKNFLKSCGFNCSLPMTKTRHPENKLFLLYYRLDKLPKTYELFAEEKKKTNAKPTTTTTTNKSKSIKKSISHHLGRR